MATGTRVSPAQLSLARACKHNMPLRDEDNIVDQVLHDVDDEIIDDGPERMDEDGSFRESGELKLNDTDDGHHRRKERVDKRELNICCTQCMSKSKSSGKACICQVPSRLRRGPLGKTRCFLKY